MRKAFIGTGLLLLLTLAVTALAGGAAAAPLPVPPRAEAGLQDTTGKGLPGAAAALQEALQAAAPVRYRVLVIDATDGMDRTAYLDRVLAEWGWPAADTLLLVVFRQANYDIRFAMGANFRQAGVTVDEMVQYVRTVYQPAVYKGDPAYALAALVGAVNQRMGARQPLAWLEVRPDAVPGSGASYERSNDRPDGMAVEDRTTRSLAEARRFLGEGVALPPALEGREMLVWRTLDKDGQTYAMGLSEQTLGFWVRWRADGNHRVLVKYGDGYTLLRERRTLDGRPALLLKAVRPVKEGPAEIWMEDGKWVYELRDPVADMERLVKLAEGME